MTGPEIAWFLSGIWAGVLLFALWLDRGKHDTATRVTIIILMLIPILAIFIAKMSYP